MLGWIEKPNLWAVEEAKKAVDCGVDLICTDRPDIVRSNLINGD
jgi:hypothetical protein